jgi:hypothetical protein
LRSESVAGKSAVAGAKLRPNDVRSARNGRWDRSESVDTSSVDGDREIVDCKALELRLIASNVDAISVNNRAFTPATGATVAMNESNDRKNRDNPVPGSDRYRATGVKCLNNAGKLAIVSFNAAPRPANVSPNPVKSRLIADRVFGSNVEKI